MLGEIYRGLENFAYEVGTSYWVSEAMLCLYGRVILISLVQCTMVMLSRPERDDAIRRTYKTQ